MRHLDGVGGLIIGGFTLNNLRYADDIVLEAHSKEKLQEMLDIVHLYSEENGLSINIKKTESIVKSKYENNRDSRITLKGNPIKQVENFKYLGTGMTNDGKCQKRNKIKNCNGKRYIL